MGGGVPFPVSQVLIKFEDRNADEGGFYMPDGGEAPRIFIFRHGFVDDGCYRALDVARVAPDPFGELLWLSHELGHHDVVVHGHGTGIFDREKPLESYTEEVEAWGLARELLAGRGFNIWPDFDAFEMAALKTCEAGLGLRKVGVEAARERVRALLAGTG